MDKNAEAIDPAQEELQAHIDYYRALEWKAENPDAWGYLVGLALSEAKHKRHFGAQWLIEQTRKKDFVDKSGQQFKLNNTYAPVFARLIANQYPEVVPYLETRKSRFDGLLVGGAYGTD